MFFINALSKRIGGKLSSIHSDGEFPLKMQKKQNPNNYGHSLNILSEYANNDMICQCFLKMRAIRMINPAEGKAILEMPANG